MKAFVDTVLARRWVLVALVIVFALLFPAISASLIALQTAQRGVVQGIGDSLLAALAVSIAAFAIYGGSALPIDSLVALAVGVGLGIAILRLGHLKLVYQTLVLLSFAGIGLVLLLGPPLEELTTQLMETLVTLVRAQGAEETTIALFDSVEPFLLGLMAGLMFCEVMLPLLLAYWLICVARGLSFGQEFRALRLGLSLGIPGALVLTSRLVFDGALVQNASVFVLFVFLFQGLAVVHSWAFARKWHPILLVFTYLLILPLHIVWLLMVSAIGVVDNVFDLRALAEKRSK